MEMVVGGDRGSEAMSKKGMHSDDGDSNKKMNYFIYVRTQNLHHQSPEVGQMLSTVLRPQESVSSSSLIQPPVCLLLV